MEVGHGRTVTLAGEQLDGDRLGHGYATNVHRAQGATSTEPASSQTEAVVNSPTSP